MAVKQKTRKTTPQEWLRGYYQNLSRWFSLSSKLFIVDFTPCLENIEYTHNVDILVDYANGDGKLYLETVETACAVAEAILEGDNIALLGLIQSAKTHSQFLGVLLGCIISYLHTGKMIHPLYLVPNQKGTYLSQFDSKCHKLYQSIKKARVRIGKKEISIQEYVDSASSYRNDLVHKFITSNASQFGNMKVLKKIEGDLAKRSYLLLGSSRRYEDFFRVLFKCLPQAGHKLVIARDESHFAIADGSVTDRMFRDKGLSVKSNDSCLDDKSIYDLISSENRKYFQFLATSATNYAGLHLRPILVRIASNYCGIDIPLPSGNGWLRVADSLGVKIRKPCIESLTTIGKKIGIPTLARIRPTLFKNIDKFLEVNEEEGWKFAGHNHYRQWCADCIGRLIAYLFRNNPKKGRGILLRFCNDNLVMRDLAQMKEFKRHIPDDVKIIPEFDGEHDTVAEMLEQHGLHIDGRYLIMVTGGGRMSDTFQPHCCYGLDFTYDSVSWTSLLQGIVGRMFGYDKDPLIIVSDKNFDVLCDIQNDPDRALEKPCLHCVSNPSKEKYLKLRFMGGKGNKRNCPPGDIILHGMRSRLEKWLQIKPQTLVTAKNGMKQKRIYLGKKGSDIDFFKQIAGELELQHMERLFNVKLLRPFEIDGQMRQYLRNEFGVVMTTRMHGEGYNDLAQEGVGVTNPHEKNSFQLVLRATIQPNGKVEVSGIDFLIYLDKAGVIDASDTVPGRIKR